MAPWWFTSRNTFHLIIYVTLYGTSQVSLLQSLSWLYPVFTNLFLHWVHYTVKSHLTQRLHFNTSALDETWSKISLEVPQEDVSLGDCYIVSCWMWALPVFLQDGNKSLLLSLHKWNVSFGWRIVSKYLKCDCNHIYCGKNAHTIRLVESETHPLRGWSTTISPSGPSFPWRGTPIKWNGR